MGDYIFCIWKVSKGRRKKEEGRRKKEEGRGKNIALSEFYSAFHNG
ncbi:hypothetical protein [Okeania sp. SIO2C2]|nr:hypothetical protein [Okeania sp. SIO2C2]